MTGVQTCALPICFPTSRNLSLCWHGSAALNPSKPCQVSSLRNLVDARIFKTRSAGRPEARVAKRVLLWPQVKKQSFGSLPAHMVAWSTWCFNHLGRKVFSRDDSNIVLTVHGCGSADCIEPAGNGLCPPRQIVCCRRKCGVVAF